jgi:hypothetical protein
MSDWLPNALWLDDAKELKLGGNAYVDCNCGAGRTLVINHRNNGYSAFCFRCDGKGWEEKGRMSIAEITAMNKLNEEARSFTSKIVLPKDFSADIPIAGRLWLYRASITESLIKKYNIGYSEELKRVIVPVYRYNKLVWFIGRAVFKGQEPKYLAPSENRDRILFQSGKLNKTIVVTEDILSAIRVGQLIGSVSLLGTKLSIEQLTVLMDYKVILWLDSDAAGRHAATKMAKELGMVTDVYDVCTKTDPKMLSKQEIHDVLKEYV